MVEAAKDKGWPESQNALAKKLGRSQGSVQAWVRGESVPAMKGAIEIAGRLGVRVEWLLTGEAPKNTTPDDPELLELIEIWTKLAPEAQKQLLRYARFCNSDHPTPAPSPENAPHVVHDRAARYRTRK